MAIDNTYRGKSIMLNGSSDYMTSTFLPSATAFSFGMWVYPFSKNTVEQALTGSSGTVFHWQDFSPAKGIYMQTGTYNGQVLQYGNIADGAGNGYNIQSLPFPTGEWKHFGFVYKSLAIEKMFLNGMPIERYLTESDPGYITAPDPQYVNMAAAAASVITLGKDPNLTTNYYKGNVANLVMQNSAWSDETMADLYVHNTIPDGSAWYDFDNNTVDKSGQGYDITLSGCTYSARVPVG